MGDESKRCYALFLTMLPECGSVTIRKLLQRYGSPEEVYLAAIRKEPGFSGLLGKEHSEKVLDMTAGADPQKSYEEMLKNEITMVIESDEIYPARLRKMEKPPYAIFVKGKLPEDDIPAVAIIGARNCSPYGEYTAEEFGAYLASRGVNIISGMARGIDGIAQRGALRAGGHTYAVLGSGADVCYPASNRDLYGKICREGGAISIFPPGSAPLARNFPARNAIVSALSDLILVIEARARSGTSNTVEHALHQAKEVYAVPGRITDRLSDGCNLLIRQGAGAALSPEDLYRELGVLKNRAGGGGSPSGNDSPEEEKRPGEERVTGFGDTKKGKRSGAKIRELSDCVTMTPKSAEMIHERWKKVKKDAVFEETVRELVLLTLDGRILEEGGWYYRKGE
ncbi:MAG: DNA-processing protein DprA [Lachnospiraceae bacterium]|nr:DNA-processing protein DprA [Lachnospiraceae bacterium]